MRIEKLVKTLGHLAKGEGEPGLIASKELSGTNVVGDESSDDTEVATGFGDGNVTSECTWKRRKPRSKSERYTVIDMAHTSRKKPESDGKEQEQSNEARVPAGGGNTSR